MATKQMAILERSMALTILVSWGVLPLSPMISGRDDNDDDQLVAIVAVSSRNEAEAETSLIDNKFTRACAILARVLSYVTNGTASEPEARHFVSVTS